MLVPETAESVQYNTTPALWNRMDERKCRNTVDLLFSPDASSVSPSTVRLLCTELCRTNVISGAAWVGCQSQRATAHCRFYRRDELPLSLQERRLKDTMVRRPHILSRSPSLCFFFFFFFCRHQIFWLFYSQRASTYADDNAAGGTIPQWSHSDSDHIRTVSATESDGEEEERCKVHQNLTPHTAEQDSGTVWNYFVTSQILSPPLFSPPLIFMSASPPAVLSFSVFPQCLHFEPDSINLSGKLQMFWAELCKPRRNKAAEKKSMAFSLYFIIHHGPRSSQGKTWLTK